MEIDINRLTRDYTKQPLKLREKLPLKDLIYLYIELNWCYTQIGEFLGKPARWVSIKCKEHGLIKTKEKQKEALENYYLLKIGVKNPALLESSQEKKKATMLKKYGVENIALLEETTQKRKTTCLKKYGTDNPAKVEEFIEKKKQTCIKKYGTEYPQKTQEVKEKQATTMIQRYGYKGVLQCPQLRAKIEQTCLERYGVKNPFQNKEIREKYRKNLLKNYGIDNIAKSPTVIKKLINTKKERGNLNKSAEELKIKELLENIFNIVKTQYDEDYRYPFQCDFYLPELDLFIEYQGFISHGYQPFGLNKEYDEKLLHKWNNKVLNYKNKYPNKPLYNCAYYNYIQNWTITDPLKREIAKQNGLNWIEFFSMNEFIEWYKNLCEILK